MIFNSQTYCALIILLELAECYSESGCLLADISAKHNIPMSELEAAKIKLERAKLIYAKGRDNEWLFLSEEPSQVQVLTVIELFSKNFFEVFVDTETGRAVPQNNTMLFLDQQRRNIEHSIKKRWHRTSLEGLSQMRKNRQI